MLRESADCLVDISDTIDSKCLNSQPEQIHCENKGTDKNPHYDQKTKTQTNSNQREYSIIHVEKNSFQNACKIINLGETETIKQNTV